jgi:hypothetical protein
MDSTIPSDPLQNASDQAGSGSPTADRNRVDRQNDHQLRPLATHTDRGCPNPARKSALTAWSQMPYSQYRRVRTPGGCVAMRHPTVGMAELVEHWTVLGDEQDLPAACW